MKEEYSKPWVEVMLLRHEGTLCMSNFDGQNSIIQDVTIDEDFKW